MKLNDDILRSALLDAAADEYNDLTEADVSSVVFSKKYLAKRRRFLIDPFKRSSKSSVRIIKFMAQAAVFALVIFSFLFSAKLTQNASATELQRMNKVFKDDLTYSVSEEYTPVYEIGTLTVNYLPDGFTEYKREYKTDFCNVNYINGTKIIDLVCFHTSAYMNISLNSSKYYMEVCEIGGKSAIFHRAHRDGCTNVLMWFSADGEIVFLLDAALSKDEMINIAESVILD